MYYYTYLCIIRIINMYIQNDYQQQLEEKMRIQATEYEEKLKATETRAENAEKSVNWSHVSVL